VNARLVLVLTLLLPTEPFAGAFAPPYMLPVSFSMYAWMLTQLRLRCGHSLGVGVRLT
jgi:hypothetical protein